MGKRKMTDAEKHNAGAIITHRGRFDHLATYSHETKVTTPFIDTWVIPFYMKLHDTDQEWIDTIVELYPEMNDEVILTNLGDFNWRTRSTGSFFAAIKNKHEFTKIIGNHLLKSEVCYAGAEYAVTLSFFNTKKSISYLNQYLDYYLLHPELYFDQREVLAALKYFDSVNGSDFLSKHLANWESMLASRKELKIKNLEAMLRSPDFPEEAKQDLKGINFDNIDFSIDTEHIEKRICTIQTIQATVNARE